MPFSVFSARRSPTMTASSKLVLDVAEISVI
jgi:hypothetical protein